MTMKLTIFLLIFLIANTVGNDESIDSESSENSDLTSFDNNDLAGEGRDFPENSVSHIEFPEHSFPKRVLKNNWYQ